MSAAGEQADLRNRLRQLEGLDDLPADDLLRPQVLAKVSLDAWRDAGMTLPRWRLIQAILHDELGDAFTAALHDSNAFLQSAGVMPEVDLRPLIRRSTSAPGSSMPGADSGSGGGTPHHTAGSAGPTSAMGAWVAWGRVRRSEAVAHRTPAGWGAPRGHPLDDPPRRPAKTVDRAQGTLKQLNAWVEQHVGTPFVRTVGLDVSPELQAALAEPVQDPAAWVSQAEVSTQQLVQRIQQKAHIKQNSKTPVEAGHHRGGGIAVPDHPHRRAFAAGHPGVVRPFADSRVAGGRVRAGILRRDHPSARRLIDRMGPA